MTFSPGARAALSTLTSAGFEAYLVGGAVRDLFLRRAPHDYDIATSATPEEIAALFPRTLKTGARFGSVTVLLGDERLEITTFRADGAYLDGRRPESVRFSRDIREDLLRRDFTVCAMALAPDQSLIDPTGGRHDLAARVVRAVGDPGERFREDALRILRALRFASTLDFALDGATLHAALECRELLRKVSAERILSELLKLLSGRGAERILLLCYPILEVVLPGLSRLAGLEMHNPAHAYDVLTHTAKAVSFGPPDPYLRLALLLHDFGKPDCYSEDPDGTGHFFGHAERSAALAAELLPALRLPRRERERIIRLIREHQFPFSREPVELQLLLARFGERDLLDLLRLRAADVGALRPGMDGEAGHVLAAMDTVRQLAATSVHRVRDLALSGAELGFLPPERIGPTLSRLLEEVIRGDLKNERAALLERARTL